MNIDNLIAFIKATEYSNMTKAAQDLFITQQALSHQIAILEEELGAPLFIRGRVLQLTPVGERCYPVAKEIVSRYQHLMEFAALENEGLHGRLNIGYFSITYDFCMKTLHQFTEDHPKVQTTARAGGPEDLVRQLREGTLDVVFVGKHAFPQLKELSSFDVLENHLNIIVSEKSPFAELDAITLSMLKDTPFCFFERIGASDSIDHLIWLCKSCGFSPKIEFRARNLEEMQMFVALNKGAAFSSSLQSSVMRGVKTIALVESKYDDYYNIACVYNSNADSPELKNYLKTVKALSEIQN